MYGMFDDLLWVIRRLGILEFQVRIGSRRFHRASFCIAADTTIILFINSPLHFHRVRSHSVSSTLVLFDWQEFSFRPRPALLLFYFFLVISSFRLILIIFFSICLTCIILFPVENYLWILGFFLPLENVLKDGFMMLLFVFLFSDLPCSCDSPLLQLQHPLTAHE